MLTQEYLHKLFEYRDGDIYWKVSKSRYVHIGDRAGTTNKEGYRQVRIDGKTCLVHRVIFMMFYGYMPNIIDHKNMIRDDNHIENLRAATLAENGQNSKIRSGTRSGFKGVYWSKGSKKWRVNIKVDGKLKHFGLYEDLELASLVAIEAREKYHGDFARHE